MRKTKNSTGISMSLDSLAPVVPRPKDDLQLAGTITNTSDREIGGANVELRLSQERMGNRAQLAKVADGSETPNTRGVSNGSVEVKATLAPGASAPWSIKVPMSDLGLGNSGVYGLRVDATSRDRLTSHHISADLLAMVSEPRFRQADQSRVVVAAQ
ncbi:MAG: DUF6049 family protein [Candidatus Nanopelagicales bacterium]